MESPEKENKVFVGFMAVGFTTLGLAALVCIASILVAMWQAGLKNFLVWMVIFGCIAWISTFVYHRLLETDWL